MILIIITALLFTQETTFGVDEIQNETTFIFGSSKSFVGRGECSVTRRPRKTHKPGESLKAFKMDILKRTIKVRRFLLLFRKLYFCFACIFAL